MNETFARLEELNNIALSYGKELVIALALLVFGLIAAQYLRKYANIMLKRIIPKPAVAATITNILYVLFLLFVVRDI